MEELLTLTDPPSPPLPRVAAATAVSPPTTGSPVEDTGCDSPKPTTSSAAATAMSPSGTGNARRPRAREAELEELLEISNRAREELEAALIDERAALTTMRLEVERIQLGDAADELSSEGDLHESDEALSEDLSEDEALRPAGRTEANDAIAKLMLNARREHEERAARKVEEAAKAARRAAVAKLKLPTEQQPPSSTVDWDEKRFREAEKKTQEKRSKLIDGSAEAPSVPKPRKGKHGWKHNSRQGLVGAIQYWADGSRANVILMLLGLIDHFGVADDVRAKLFRKSARQAETDTLIVDRLVEALEVLKGCQTEQQRKDYKLALSLVAHTTHGTYLNTAGAGLPTYQRYRYRPS